MAFEGSYLANLRKKVGHDLVIMPGACVLVEDHAGRLLLTLRQDNGLWCFPGGAVEPEGDFATAALTELLEEAGVEAERHDLIPFATSSDPNVEKTSYHNGDVTQYFVLCYVVRQWRKKTGQVDETEVSDIAFYAPDKLPGELTRTTEYVLERYKKYQQTGVFQAG